MEEGGSGTGALSGVQQRWTKGREPCDCPSTPQHMGDTEVARGRSVGSPATASVQPGACALKAAHFPLSSWDQLQRPARECKAGGGPGARVWMMSLAVWPPVCLISEVRGPPSPAAALGKPPIPHRSFSRALHSLSPPQTWAGSQAAFSPQRSTPGRGSRPPGGHGTDLLSGYISRSAAGSAREGGVEGPLPTAPVESEGFLQDSNSWLPGPSIPASRVAPRLPRPCNRGALGRTPRSSGQLAPLSRGAWKRLPGASTPSELRAGGGPGGRRAQVPAGRAAGWGRAGTGLPPRGSARRRPPPSGPARPRPAVLGMARGRGRGRLRAARS